MWNGILEGLRGLVLRMMVGRLENERAEPAVKYFLMWAY
jgi:hypothetical protein